MIGVNAFKKNGKSWRRKQGIEARDDVALETLDGSSSSRPSDLGYASDRERALHSQLLASKVFKDVKSRRGSIVKPCFPQPDFHSAAGVLMTCLRDEDDFSRSDVRRRLRPKLRSTGADLPTLRESDVPSPESTYMRSYSFGSDAKMIRKLQEGPLQALKHELKRNHQLLPEDELSDVTVASSLDKETSKSRAKSSVKQTTPVLKSLTMPESFRRFSASAATPQSNRSASMDGWFKSRSKVKPQQSLDAVSPIKDVMQSLSFFSSESAVASLKSGLKYAVRLAESPVKRASQDTGCGAPAAAAAALQVSRSQTLPSEGDHLLESVDKSPSKSEAGESLPEDVQSASASPWSLGGKRVDYWNSTLKSAATSVASRFSEIKSNLSANSPAKLTGTISQWATMVAEKIPANLVPEDNDEDDDSSDHSLDARRSSCAISDDDVSDTSAGNPRSRVLDASAFEAMERHYESKLVDGGSRDAAVVLVIEMSSCCRCYACSALVFDEEVMEGWSADDSNLNTECVHCSSRFVPLLTVTLISKVHASWDPKSFTVPYLSPLVLRKEVESVLEHEGDMSLLRTSFVDAHPIIYWNLVWYFERTNLPTHLPGLALPSVMSVRHPCSPAPPSCPDQLFPLQESNQYTHANVSVTCWWDNERLHEDMSRPMYRCWIDQSKLTSAQSDWHPHDSLDSTLDAESEAPSLVSEKREVTLPIMRQVVSGIEMNKMAASVRTLVTERLKAAASGRVNHSYSIYRDLLFLSFVALGRENIDQREYPACVLRLLTDS